jgi:ABC-2 type transport system ATP-binding protein
VGNPRGLILDEPTAAVDPEGHHLIGDVLRELRDAGLALAVTTHQLADAEQFADRVVILTHGEVAASGPLDTLRAQQLTVFELSQHVAVDDLSRAVGCAVEEDGRLRYRIVGQSISPAEVDRALRSLGVELVSVRTRATLEERYLDIVREAEAR